MGKRKREEEREEGEKEGRKRKQGGDEEGGRKIDTFALYASFLTYGT